MSSLFKNKSVRDIGIGFTTVYTCDSPNVSSIIIGMSIANKIIKVVTLEVRVYDSSTDTYTQLVTQGSRIDVGGSLILAGELQKIILEQNDTIEVRCSDIDGLDVFMSIIDNNPTYIVYYYFGDIGLFAGGYNYISTMHGVTISINSDATSFGNLTVGRGWAGSVSDEITGIIAGGYSNTSSMDYITFSTKADASLFANLTVGRYHCDGSSDGTVGVMASDWATVISIDHILMKQQVDATYFGDLTIGRSSMGASGDGTVGIFASGYSTSNVVDYITFSTKSNATNFSSYVSRGTYYLNATSDSTMSLNYGSAHGYKEIKKIIFATRADAINFGDLYTSGYVYGVGICGNHSTALFAAGTGSLNNGNIQKVEYASTMMSEQFGNLTENKYGLTGLSGN